MSNPQPFRVALTADFYNADGSTKFPDLGLSVFEPYGHIQTAPFAEHRKAITPDQLTGFNGVIVLTPSVTAETVSQSENLLAVGRFGVGYDAVDVKACTAADVVAFITPGAVDRPVAEATVGWMIALTHNTAAKDRLVRTGQWDERSKFMGSELRDRTLGLVGLGGIARKVVELLKGWGMNPPIAYDPYATPDLAEKAGVQLVSLEELYKSADFISIHCPLTEQSRNLIGQRAFEAMKPGAYLINTARGGIVDEDALSEALKGGRLAGAALDCFAEEPVTKPSRFAEFENVILAPHSIAWTRELFRDIGRSVCQGMLDLSLMERLKGVLNPEVFDRQGFAAKWKRICGKGG
jgi:phosphoglycerate dehydrogenase-like enzyme